MPSVKKENTRVMKNYLPLLLLVYSISITAQSDKELQELVRNEAHHHEHFFDYRTNELTTDYDIKYHRMEWEVNPEILYIKGNVTTYFEPSEADFLSIHFDFSDALSIDSILYHDTHLNYSQPDEATLQINFNSPLPKSILDSVTIYYQGVPNTTGFGSFRQSTHNDVPIIWTLSEPYGARDWWPCKQDLNDKIDSIDIIVQTPKAYRVASNGVLINEHPIDSSIIYHWRHRYPIPAYLIAIGVTNYVVYSDFVPTLSGDIEVLNYVYPEDSLYAAERTPATVEIMQLFNELFGIYPFAKEKYGHAQFGFGGGMEHQTMSFMGGWSHLLQAHELAHQWFGDKVTCGSWEDIWLNEGFATYLEGLTYENNLGPNTWKAWKQGKLNHITSKSDGSVWVSDTTDRSRIFNSRLSYSKGAYLLHMLRWKLGDEDFFKAIRNYLEAPGIAFGYAKTHDLIFHLEDQSGQDLTEFFDDWYYGEGYPTYQINWSQSSDLTLQIKLEQTTSHPSVEFYEMPVPIHLSGNEGDSTLVLNHDFSGQVFTIQVDFEVDELSFDPELWLLAKSEINLVSDSEIFPVLVSNFYPNPVGDVLNIQINNPDWIDEIRVVDSKGRTERRVTNHSNGAFRIKVKDLANGVYFLKIESKKIIRTYKFIKL